MMVDPGGPIIAPGAERPAGHAAANGAAGRKTASNFSIWKTITLGTYRDVNALREDLDCRPLLQVRPSMPGTRA